MAYDSGLTSVKMRQILACGLGGALGDVGLAIHATNKYNVLTANAVDATTPKGNMVALAAVAELDLSASDGSVPANGKIIKPGKTGYIFISMAGNAELNAYFGDDKITSTRATPASALVYGAGNHIYVPKDFPYETLVIVGYIKVVNGTGSNFVIGTTAFDAVSITTTFVDTKNLLPGTKME
jgi:hypothetical protein